MYLFLAALGLCCCAWAFSSCSERGPLFVAVRRLLIEVASLVAEHGLQACGLQQLWYMGSVVVARRLQSTGSVVVVHGLSCSVACGIFPDQGSNPCPLHWQADSQPLCHQGSPNLTNLSNNKLDSFPSKSSSSLLPPYIQMPLFFLVLVTSSTLPFSSSCPHPLPTPRNSPKSTKCQLPLKIHPSYEPDIWATA